MPSTAHKKESWHRLANSRHVSFRVEDTGYFEIVGCIPSVAGIGRLCRALEVQLCRSYEECQREKRKKLFQGQMGRERREGYEKRGGHERREGQEERERHAGQRGQADIGLPSFLDPQLQLFEKEALNDWQKIEPLRKL